MGVHKILIISTFFNITSHNILLIVQIVGIILRLAKENHLYFEDGIRFENDMI